MAIIRSYKDGDRVILVIENCVGEVAKQTAKFVAMTLGVYEPQVITDLSPAPSEDPGMPVIDDASEVSYHDIATKQDIDETDYYGLTVQEALSKHGAKAAAEILSTNDNARVRNACQDFIYSDLYSMESDKITKEEFLEFYSNYSSLIGSFLKKQVLERMGYPSMPAFVNNADLDLVQDAFAIAKDELMKNT